jgi:hypothetical protein
MKGMNANDGLSKLQLTLATSRWQVMHLSEIERAARHLSPRIRIRPSLPPPRHSRALLSPYPRRYTRLYEQELCEMNRACTCALS